jgi:hypothetical protein
MPAETRAVVTSAGGRGRAALPAEQLSQINRAGAAAINSAAGLARRIVKRWPELTEDERAEVLDVLVGGGLPLSRRGFHDYDADPSGNFEPGWVERHPEA